MISDENLAQLEALVERIVEKVATRVVERVVTGLLQAHGLKPVKAVKNAATAERMRRYRNAKRNAPVTKNVTHSPTKRNGARNANVTERNADAVEVLQFLNAETKHKFPPVKATLDLIVARFNEGYTPVQLRQIIVRKNREWGGDPKMAPFLRPKTIFGKMNAANYAGDLVVPND